MGEGQALPPTPGLPLRGGFPMDTSPCQMAMGEEEQLIRGRAKPSPAPPGLPLRGRFPMDTSSCQMAMGAGEPLRRGELGFPRGPELPRRW